jgi:hypothetical protein
MSKLALFSFIALTIGAGAEETIVMSGSTQNSSSNGCPPPCTPPPPLQIVTLTTASPASCNGWYTFADVLYWHADVGGADWAFKNSNTTTPIITGPNHSLDFKWAWGFRAGLGMTMAHDDWDSNFYYTWFQTAISNSVGSKTDQIAVDNIGKVGMFAQGKANWGIHFSMFDWELGRWFYVSRCLSLRPHVGIKGGWIHQKIHKSFSGTTGTTPFDWVVNVKNNFWGVGPSAGLNTKWLLGNIRVNQFALFGDFAAALMYGHFHVSNSEIPTVLSPLGPFGFHPSHLNRNLAVPMLQAIFGFSWDRGFQCDCYHLGIRVGYEFQYWFRQNQTLMNEVDPDQAIRYQRAHDDLAFQGLTIDFRFDF